MCWISTIGSAAKPQTTTQLAVVSMYMSRGRSWVWAGRPGPTRARPAMKVIRLDQRKAKMSSVRSKASRVSMGMTMLTARVMRKMPMMKPMMRKVGRDMELSGRGEAGRAILLGLWVPRNARGTGAGKFFR
ncbi:hypothetical protein D9M70_558040 [compost metagenome]